MTGYVHIYTGNGKGKTTAALGLALRAAGAGFRVYIAQFAKGMEYSELKALEKLAGNITLRQFGQSCFIGREPEAEDYSLAENGMKEISEAVTSGEYKMVILDEANIATWYNLVTVEALLELIDSKPDDVEIVLTGRYADRRLLERADLVTEMKEVKHYYNQGVMARVGIEK
jgi:cob(I)alamin adenosyltransferase